MKTVLQIAALLIIVFSFSPSANGQQVVLDMSFGDSGKVITAPDTTSTINEIAIQPDGKIVAVGYLGLTTWQRRFLIVRYNHDGSLDTSFGMRGKLDLNMTNNQDEARSVFIQPDGKIVVGGIAEDTIHHTSYFTILRLKPNGNFDSTFGSNHNGIVKTHANPTNNFSDDDLKKILRLPNGKILCGGSTLTSVSDTGFCFVQLDTNGVQDPSFGFYGRKIFQRKYPRNYMNMGLQSSGKVIAAMAISLDVYEVVRLLPNGNIDSTFGINGSIPPYVNTDTGLISALGLAIQDDDKIVLSGSVRGLYNYITVVRITANGAFDTSFGGTGKIINPAGLINGYGSSVNMLPNGGILIGGTIYPPSSYSNFVIMQLRANGSLDTTFGRRGLVFTDFKKGGDRSSCLLLQPGSGIVIAGTTASTAAYTKMALARYYTAALKTNFVHLETFVDKNANGTREPSEPFFTEANVVAYKAGNSDTRFNASGGKFNIETDTGTYLWKLPVFANYTIVPASYTTAHSTYFNQDSFAFGLQPVPGYKNLAITVVPLSPMRRYMPMQYLIVCTNKGTDTLSSSYRFVMDSNLVFFSASQMPASIVGDTISWNFSNLAPWDTTQVLLTLKFGQPASVSIGDTLTSFANVMPATGEPDTTDNKTTLIQIVRGSIDPNDKTENHGGKISTTEVASGDYLQYTIRFQNSGNDTAFNVYIHDTLDSKLDWSTMQILTASHNYQMTMTDGNKCLFTFRNINLVDSLKNEPGSHGYIVYRIKPKATVQLGDIIKNTAAIYFDYNLPIYTNTEMTIVVAESFPLKLLTFTARKQDKTNLLQWTTTNEINVDYFIVERSLNGRDFSTIGKVKANATFSGTGNYSYTDPTRNEKQQTLFYRLKMLDKDGQFTYSPIRSLTINNLPLTITIYPNPAKDNLQVEIDLTPTPLQRKGTMQLQVLSMDGKIMLSNSINAVEGSILRSVNINSLQKGNYLLKVSTTDKDESVVRFEKM